MKKETELNIADPFIAEVSPEIHLIDLTGRVSSLAGPHLALQAIETANRFQELRGSGKTVSALVPELVPGTHGAQVEEALLLYYRTPHGRPAKADMTRAAKVIAQSRINGQIDNGKTQIRVTGSRAVVYPQRGLRDRDYAVLLVSTRVWYNENRSVTHFPATPAQREVFLEDINARLTFGEVSFPR